RTGYDKSKKSQASHFKTEEPADPRRGRTTLRRRRILGGCCSRGTFFRLLGRIGRVLGSCPASLLGGCRPGTGPAAGLGYVAVLVRHLHVRFLLTVNILTPGIRRQEVLRTEIPGPTGRRVTEGQGDQSKPGRREQQTSHN